MRKVGEKVRWKGKEYVISSVMDNKHANWIYSLRVPGSTDYKESATIFKDKLDEFEEENKQQTLSLFEEEST